jgi:hypothetical protein
MLNYANELDDLEYILSHDDIMIMEKVHFVININQLIYKNEKKNFFFFLDLNFYFLVKHFDKQLIVLMYIHLLVYQIINFYLLNVHLLMLINRFIVYHMYYVRLEYS